MSVELNNVSVTYHNGYEALHKVNLLVEDGEFVFVVGASGAGKSTLIKLLLRELAATTGIVKVNGFDLTKMRKSKIPKLRRSIGTVFQDFRLIPTLNVFDNIAFVLRCVDKPRSYINQRVPYLINLVNLNHRIHSMPNELSGGEQQRVALARALANDPKLLIADEPTGNIDPELSYEILDLLKGINECGTTVVIVTHEHELVQHFGGRVISISDGQIAFDEQMRGEGG
ncbi:MAG: cell division ATP-binding protein FtsE [Oscillospiraceae bacterium]|jgi:cell division transport system ATP-binding protein|nr:cell division ATP-binding protein FtsE [Oscillospiraceae bacterium]